MNLALTMNLIAIVVVPGGWAFAVWALYRHLGDPYQRPAARRQPGAAPVAAQVPAQAPAPAPEQDGRSRPGLVLTDHRAA